MISLPISQLPLPSATCLCTDAFSLMSWQGKTVSQLCACVQYALLMMPIAAAIEEKIPATSTHGLCAKLGAEGKRWGPICCNLSADV